MSKLEVSVQTAKWFEETDPAASMKYIKECGFESVDYNINSLFRASFDEENLTSFFDKSIEELKEYYRPLKEAMIKNGVTMGQSHGILVIYHKDNPKKTEYCINVTKKMLAVCQYLDCKAIVIHPWIGSQFGVEKQEEIEINMWLYRQLMPAAKEYGVKICLENLWEKQHGVFVDAPCIDAHEACRYIDVLNREAGKDVYGFCLDIGHTQFYRTDIYAFIKMLGKRLTALHLHENNGILDSHLIPYTQADALQNGVAVDWERMLQALAEIQYEGNLSFETCNAIVNLSEEMKALTLRYICQIGQYFKNRLSE